MKGRIIDISLPLREDMVFWKNVPGFMLEKVRSLEKGDPVDDSRVEMSLHAGTHIDSPRHYLRDGKFVHQLPLEKLIGPAKVVYVPNAKAIGVADLESAGLEGARRVLFRTENSEVRKRGEKSFREDFVGLDSRAALWLAEKGVELVGTDYLGVGQYEHKEEVHRVLLEKEVIVVEGLNLADVEPGEYELICFPIKIINSEAVPVRAVLIN